MTRVHDTALPFGSAAGRGHATTVDVVRSGQGPRALLIHGSATDVGTWFVQLATMRTQLEMLAYTRDSAPGATIEQHAGDAAEILAGAGRSLVIGSSFGAVVALELVRTRPELCTGVVMIEPPLAASDDGAMVSRDWLAECDRIADDRGPEAAAERFLRTVLGDAAYERMPRTFQARAQTMWPAIRSDSAALLAYRPRYPELAAVARPVLLVGGGASAGYFRPTLDALVRALPDARLEIIEAAGHMLHAEAPRKFGELVVAFARACEAR